MITMLLGVDMIVDLSPKPTLSWKDKLLGRGALTEFNKFWYGHMKTLCPLFVDKLDHPGEKEVASAGKAEGKEKETVEIGLVLGDSRLHQASQSIVNTVSNNFPISSQINKIHLDAEIAGWKIGDTLQWYRDILFGYHDIHLSKKTPKLDTV
ncbi:hypothetical protein Gogos_010647 [Gossypium gossypioides]|uniref:Uncharacterized protein n=1 Tax=Gossypium gossypioides TaxID=34282 RepID=A0A7J9BM17_GOSGO|nr:hypothetical protein [Gossypium gossypioides]